MAPLRRKQCYTPGGALQHLCSRKPVHSEGARPCTSGHFLFDGAEPAALQDMNVLKCFVGGAVGEPMPRWIGNALPGAQVGVSSANSVGDAGRDLGASDAETTADSDGAQIHIAIAIHLGA